MGHYRESNFLIEESFSNASVRPQDGISFIYFYIIIRQLEIKIEW